MDESSFSRLELGDKAELLWRVEGGEVEMVMTAETRIWVGGQDMPGVPRKQNCSKFKV